MEIFQIFWLFFLLSALQPLIQRRVLEFQRKKLIASLEKDYGSRLILMIHRQETMGFLGFPIMRYIDINDSEEVLRAIHLTDPDIPIDLLLHTPGGLVLASLQIARAIKAHPARVRVIVPHFAMSGGTLIALAADEIIMSPHAVLGPVDPQLGGSPAVSVLRAVERKPIERVDDQTLIMADQAEKAMKQVRESVIELMSDTVPYEDCCSTADKLTSGGWTHDYPITSGEAKSLGLKVSGELPKEFARLMRLFPQPTRRSQTVEYSPVERRVPRDKS